MCLCLQLLCGSWQREVLHVSMKFELEFYEDENIINIVCTCLQLLSLI